MEISEAEHHWSSIEGVAYSATDEDRIGVIGCTIVGPDGYRFERHSDRRFLSASTVKIPIMIEVYRQIDRGALSPDQILKLTDADRAPGSSWLQYLHEGIEFTVDDLMTLMISISDNTATNMLIDLAGLAQINATMRDLGMTGSVLGRKMKGVPSQPGEPENWATPDDYALVIGSILDGTAASAVSCARMIEMLGRQSNDRRISRYLPKTDGVKWGSKTGTVGNTTNDVGFIEANGQRLILSFFCEAMHDVHIAEKAIGEMSRYAMIASGLVEPLEVDPRPFEDDGSWDEWYEAELTGWETPEDRSGPTTKTPFQA
jgi:beta-lactamase class A